MSSPDLFERICEQSQIARAAIAEAQAIIADCIAALESGPVMVSGATTCPDERADPLFPPTA